VKLYTYDPAPNPKRVTLFMNYKRLEIETQQIDMMAREQLGEEYRRINPACTLPALALDDGTVLTEVIGICAYLEALNPGQPLMGDTPLERAQVISWDHKLFNMVMTAIAEVLRNSSKGFVDRGLPGPLDVPQIPALAERGKLRLAHAWPTLDAEIAGREWLVGDRPSLADIDLLVCAEFSGWVKQSPPEDCANLQAFLARARATFN
jgi:glutathione S-transferase